MIVTHTLPNLFAQLSLNTLTQPQREQIAHIEQLLPQTQCGLCGHADGCLPYAAAIVTKQEDYNKCVPGGQAVTDNIAQLLGKPSLPVEPSKWPVQLDTNRPIEVRAVIREDDCIGCTKCIPACPVDAIIGSGKQMHTVFTELCTGCELCVAPCPVDCIDLVAYPRVVSDVTRQQEQQSLRARYHAHLRRVEAQVNDKHNATPVVSMVQAKLNDHLVDIDAVQAKNTIEAAKLRTQIKKLEKQLAVRADEKKQQQLDDLTAKLMALDDSQAPN